VAALFLFAGVATLGLSSASGFASLQAAVADGDGDGVDDAVDNCPTT
jgi:hypothetical protein